MRLVKGMPPPIAERNAEGAKKNIFAKYEAIRAWLNLKPSLSAIESLKGQLPRTKRQFNFWHCAPGALAPNIPEIELFANSNETLNKLPHHLELVKNILIEVREYEKSADKLAKPSRIAELQRKLSLSEKLRDIAEREMKSLLIRNEDLQSALKRQEAEHAATLEKAISNIAELKAEINGEKEKSSSLAKILSKSKSLRVV